MNKVTKKEIYETYSSDSKETIKAHRQSIKELKDELWKYRDQLIHFKGENGKHIIMGKSIDLDDFDNLPSLSIDVEAFEPYKHYYTIAKKILKKEKKIEFIKDTTYSMKTFNWVVKEFHKEIIEHIINGYRFNLPYRLGTIYIGWKKRSVPPIDWPATNANKKKLLEEGKKIYNSKTAPDGIKYYVRADPITFRLHWKNWHILEYFPELSNYVMRIVLGNHSVAHKINVKVNSLENPQTYYPCLR